MAFEAPGALAPDCAPCRYGGSRLTFRGPPVRLDRPYLAALGGCATLGRDTAEPWPAGLARRTGRPVANLGCAHAGPDLWLADAGALTVARGARLRVVQVTGATNLSNPYYHVHPRRNDRVVDATPRLRALFSEVDFAEIHFTRHLLLTLHAACPARFATVAAALQAAWGARMEALLDAIGAPTVLLWLGPAPPPAAAGLAGEPALIGAPMLAALAPRVAATVILPPPGPGAPPHAEAAARVAEAIAALA